MRRREFIGALGGAAVWPLAARAQQIRARIGMLPLGSPFNAYDKSLVDAFRHGLRDVGLVEGRDTILDVLWISGNPEDAVDELIQRGAELLVPCGSSAAVAARRKTLNLPIVFISVGNPIGMGLVESLSHPGRNVTGFSDVLADLSGKYVDLARELGGSKKRVDYLWHTEWPDGQHRRNATEQAAQTLGVPLQSWGIAGTADVSDTIAAIKKSGASIVIVQPSPFNTQRDRLIDAAKTQALALIYAFPIAAKEGALVAYGPDYSNMYRRAGVYVERIIFRGARPPDLPVQQPTKFDLVLNLKTAKVLGLQVPSNLLALADDVIE